ncbi:unnamed protein product [Adineta steineri]|uniref:Ig-like domain-containing protein n=1 Tax=Adineta steineri TaxID=433720 RepID=A0A819K6B9_9BILA|nr:unnamed protein product [Adineta steineri]
MSKSENVYPVDEIYPKKYTTILSIAGSDPSGGAGIQADLKTFSALGCYGMAVISALTAQNTQGVQDIHSLPSEFVAAQLKSILDDIAVDAVKIGMLERGEIIDQIAAHLTRFKGIIVVDPVMFAKSGDQLIKDDAIEALKQKILPFATVLTPNIHEASRLAGVERIETSEEMEVAAFKLVELGPSAVIIKGSRPRLAGRDCLAIRGASKALWFESEPIVTNNLHGTGCTFSAAITCFLARNKDIVTAIKNAKDYISQAISEGSKYQLGQGRGPVHHFYSCWSPAISFTQEAWWKISHLYRNILDHPFIKEMGEGTLPEQKFDHFIQQDYLFMRDRAKAYCILVSRTVNDEEFRNYLDESGKAISKNADELFRKYNFPNFTDNQLKKGPACTGYTDFMLSKAMCDVTECLVALLPCAILFQKIGEHLKQTGVKSNNPKYQTWIDSYNQRIKDVCCISFFLTILISSIQSSKSALKLTFTPDEKYYTEGHVVEILCELINPNDHTEASQLWHVDIKSGKRTPIRRTLLHTPPDDSLDIFKQNKNKRLVYVKRNHIRIRQILFEDTSRYECTCPDCEEQLEKKTKELHVMKLIDPKWHIEPGWPIQENAKTTLKCTADDFYPYVSHQILRNHHKIDDDGKATIPNNNTIPQKFSWEATVTPTHEWHNTTLKCTIIEGNHEKHALKILEVIFTPRFIKCEEKQYVNSTRDKSTIVCYYAGNPQPKLLWLRQTDEKHVTSDAGVTIEVTDEHHGKYKSAVTFDRQILTTKEVNYYEQLLADGFIVRLTNNNNEVRESRKINIVSDPNQARTNPFDSLSRATIQNFSTSIILFSFLIIRYI